MSVEQTSNNPAEQPTKAKKQYSIEGYAKSWKIFIDTSSLLSQPAVDQLWVDLIPLLKKYNNKVIFTLQTVEELNKHSKNTKDPDLATRATNALKQLQQLLSANLAEVRGEKRDGVFADRVYYYVFAMYRAQYNLLLIAQDNNLAKDILNMNNLGSADGRPINVKRLNSKGQLSNFYWATAEAGAISANPAKNGNATTTQPSKKVTTPTAQAPTTAAATQTPTPAASRATPKIKAPTPKKTQGSVSQESTTLDEEHIFRTCTKISTLPDTQNPVSHIPIEGEEVLTTNGTVKLVKQLGAGGEGIIYTTNTPYVAKIYKKEKNTKRRMEKIRLMLSKPIDCEGVCFPKAPLFNKNKEFVGYLMPAAKGVELGKSVFLPMVFPRVLPNWKKRDTVELCVTILKKMQYLHDRNIIMGDINPANILVVSPKEVYFVDTDSYQIEDFPCPVGTVNYTAPEIQKKTYGSFLRTKGNEAFAVATLLFMIMLPGKPPYAQQGGVDPIQNIINMDFAYPLGENTTGNAPKGKWRFCWSHLPYDLKAAFYNTFRKGEAHSTEDKRLTDEDWLGYFTYYLKLLDSGKFGEQDEESEKIFPDRLKKNRKVSYIVCPVCHIERPENQCTNGICWDCLDNKGEVYKCKKCGKEMLFKNRDKLIRKRTRPSLCPDCYNRGQQIHSTVRCVDCGVTFTINYSTYDHFKSMGYDLPKRCPSCRISNRTSGSSRTYIPTRRSTIAPSRVYPTSTRTTTRPASITPQTPTRPIPQPQKNRGSFCFITTAVCDYLGRPDDCYELNTLRDYRDNWLRHQPDGAELIVEYYNSAPLLVSLLYQSPHYSEYCQLLWTDYLKPCLALIQKGKFEECKDLYKQMVHHLKALLSPEEDA